MAKYSFKWISHNKYTAMLILAVLALVIIFSIRINAYNQLLSETKSQAIPVVETLIAKPGPESEELVLPGNTQAWHEATLYARTSGYIKKWYVDIGSPVKEGDLLAEIASPEVDAQLQQAEADLQTAIANRDLARVTAARWSKLVVQHFVTQQAADEKVSQAKALDATVIAAEKNRDRLKELVSFERITAPFDGTISSRTTDIGALINAGSGNAVVPLFHLVQSHPLRVYVKVPQNYAENIKPDMKVFLQFSQYPGHKFPAKLLETAHAIDNKTRTLLAQFILDNKEGKFLAGGFVQVHLVMTYANPLIRLPVNTLLFQKEGLQVATVDKNNRVLLKPITITRDFGTSIEIGSGLNLNEEVVVNPSDYLKEGQLVKKYRNNLSY